MITIKGIKEDDFVNYKHPSMFIAFPSCTWKCEKECGKKVCQNGTLATSPNIKIEPQAIVERYKKCSFTKAFVLGGLEPLDSWGDLVALIEAIRNETSDDIVIYTGYEKEEIERPLEYLSTYSNIVVKFGRFLPNQKSHYDQTLGIHLASDNQYAERIS